jgi:hypothetical protein
MDELTLDEFTRFLREYRSISDRITINPEDQLREIQLVLELAIYKNFSGLIGRRVVAQGTLSVRIPAINSTLN